MIPAAPSEDQALETEAPTEHGDDVASHKSDDGAADNTSVTADALLTEGETSEDSTGLKGWWKVFASTYVTIFLAEIGDKTQVTTLLMSAESHKPWLVFAGAGTALICTSLLGVLLGRWLATRLKPRTLEVGAGITLLVITLGLGWDISQGL